MGTAQALLRLIILCTVFVATALAELPTDADCKSAYFRMGQDAVWVWA